jgi:hypothetical protein
VLRDEKALSLLRAEFQTVPANDPPTTVEVLALSAALAAEPSAVEDLLRALRAKHLSKTCRLGMRQRFDALMSLCSSVPDHHRAAVHLLIVWRNWHVHGNSTDDVAASIENDWRRGLSELRRSNTRADGAGLLDRFVRRQDPTADDVATLIGLLHRTISTADKYLVASADAESYALEAFAQSFRSLDDPIQFAKDTWGRTDYARASKFLSMTTEAGFHRVARTKVPQGANAVSDEPWFKYARMSRSEFLAEMGSTSQLGTRLPGVSLALMRCVYRKLHPSC